MSRDDLKCLALGMYIAIYVIGCMVELAADLNRRDIKELVAYIRELK